MKPPRKSGDEPPRLFAAAELLLQPSTAARLRSAARKPLRNPTLRELQQDQDAKTMRRLREMAADLAASFRLRYRMIEAERDGVVEHYGICYEDGEIRIRLRHARTGRLLKPSSLVDTLCHELAHLRHLDHSVRFQKLYQRILNQARELGYYRPGPSEARPRQMPLFDAGGCGTGYDARSL